METVTVSRETFERMQRELEALRSTHLYKRLLEFEKNLARGERFTRDDLGF